jgi:hypothetical protein
MRGTLPGSCGLKRRALIFSVRFTALFSISILLHVRIPVSISGSSRREIRCQVLGLVITSAA